MEAKQQSEIKEYFSQNRIKWSQFYPSERDVIGKIWPRADRLTVLDIGCGCAGLFAALSEKFGEGKIAYTGIELDKDAAEFASKQYQGKARIINGDFGDYQKQYDDRYDIVFSLSCFDWNTNLVVDPLQSFYSMFRKSWQMVADGGNIIISLRLDIATTLMDSVRSYQYINYQGEKKGDIANYSVISVEDCSTLFKLKGVRSLTGHGYYGKPGATAVTPFKQVCFGVFALKKENSFKGVPLLDINFPLDIQKKFKTQFSETD